MDQLKAMYDPYDQNSWFSPETVSKSVDQSDSRFAEQEVLHRRSLSEPESRPEGFINGGKMTVPESGIKKEESESLETEPVTNITKLSGSSVLLLNVVEVGPNGDPMSPKFKRNAVRRSTSNIVSITEGEIGGDKQVAMRESRRKAKKMEELSGRIKQDEKPIERQRAKYIISGERASVRYLSKSSDELASNGNDTKKMEALSQPQEKPSEKPIKASKKDGGFRNFFGKLRKSRSEPNLDKNFSVLDVDSDNGEKRECLQTQGGKDEGSQETSPGVSSSSKSRLKASSFYPKNLKKNFSKSRQKKARGSINDSGIDSGQNMSKSEDHLERTTFSDNGIKRERVQLSGSVGDVATADDIGNKPIDSLISSRITNPASPQEFYLNGTEVSKNMVQVEWSSDTGDTANGSTSPSLVISPKSTSKRFFPGEIHVIPVTAVDNEHTSDSTFSSDGIRKSEIRSTVFSISESSKRPGKDPASPETNQNQTTESKERRKSYRVTEVDSRSTISSKKEVVNGNQNNSKFVRSFTSEEKPTSSQMYAKSAAYITNQSSNDGLVLRGNARNAKQTFTFGDDGNTDPNLCIQFKDIDSYNQEGRSGNAKSSMVENLVSSTRVTAKETQNRQHFSLHADSTIFKSDGQKKHQDIAVNHFKAGRQNSPNNQQINSRHEDLRVASKDDKTIQSMTVEVKSEIVQEHEVRNDSKPEDLSKNDGREPEIASPKTKHRGFFRKRIFSKGGSSSQDELDSERKESGKEDGLILSKKENATLRASKQDQNKVEVLKSESIENIEKASESRPAKTKREKEKGEFGTKIKGFITKALPQKNKSVTRNEKDVDQTASDEAKADKLEPILDKNNNTTTIAFATENKKDESKDREKLVSNSTKSQRAIFVVKHLGESDNEKIRASDDERKRVKHERIEAVSSNPERRASYGSKVKHMGDSNTVRIENFEKRTSLDGKSFKALATEKNRDGWKRDSSPITSRIPSETPARQETITKTEVVNNVEAFDLAFDFFEEELSREENSKELAQKEVHGTKVDTEHALTNLEWASNSDESSEGIKGFTIMHKKTSSLIMSKSMEDNLESVGKESGIGKEDQENLTRKNLGTKQGIYV